MYTHMHTYSHRHTCILPCTHKYTHTHVHTLLFTHVYTSMHTHSYSHSNIYTLLQTHTNSYTHQLQLNLTHSLPLMLAFTLTQFLHSYIHAYTHMHVYTYVPTESGSYTLTLVLTQTWQVGARSNGTFPPGCCPQNARGPSGQTEATPVTEEGTGHVASPVRWGKGEAATVS